MLGGEGVPYVVWVILLPLVAATLAFVFARIAPVIGLIGSLVTAAAGVALAGQLYRDGPIRYTVGGWQAPLGIDLLADGLSVVMVLMSSGVGLFVALYALGYFARGGRYFWVLWLFLLAALNALALSADLFNLYVALELLGLAAVALAALGGGREAVQAALRYLLVTLFGSLSYLLGVALLYAAHGSLDIRALGEVLAPGPPGWAALALMSVGLMLKTALFPLHFWLPPAHANAAAPVSALLSALVVKASFYMLVRLWFELYPAVATPLAAEAIGALGALAILWGSWLALRQQRVKLLVAYSTVAQLGYLFLLFPLALSAPAHAWHGAMYYMLSHATAKAAMFMAAGSLQQALGHDRIEGLAGTAASLPFVAAAFGLAGVTMMGLPPTGTFVAKWLLLEAALGSGRWLYTTVIILGGLLAAAYVFRVLRTMLRPGTVEGVRPLPAVMTAVPLALAIVSMLLALTAWLPLLLLDIGAPAVLGEEGGR